MSAADDGTAVRNAPQAFASAIFGRPERRDVVLEALGRTRGPAFVERVLAELERLSVPRWDDAEATAARLSALDNHAERALALVQLAMGHLGAIHAVLLPAYHRALAALDTVAVKALIAQVVCGVARIREADAWICRLVPEVDVSSRAAEASGVEAPRPADPATLAMLTGRRAALAGEIHRTMDLLVLVMSPQWFGGHRISPVLGMGTHNLGMVQLTYEVGLVVRLLDEAEAIANLLGADSARGGAGASETTRREALERLARWRTRPANLFFLVHVLEARGVAHALQAPTTGAPGLQDLVRRGIAQAKATGLACDVGPLWDLERARDALHAAANRHVAESAMSVYDMLKQADPWARADLVRQLDRAGLLDRLCRVLPRACVRDLWQTVRDGDVASLLRWRVPDAGGDDERLAAFLRAQESWYHDALDEIFRAPSWEIHTRIPRPITERAYRWAIGKLIGQAALSDPMRYADTAAAWLAGNVHFALGLTEDTLAIGEPSARRFIGDGYDQILMDRRPFDLSSSHVQRFAKQGFAAPVLASVPLVAAPYLPNDSPLPRVHRLAAAHRPLARLLEHVRIDHAAAELFGCQTASVHMPVGELVAALESGVDVPALRVAGSDRAENERDRLLARLASAPPAARASLEVRVLADLYATGTEEGELLEIASVALE